MATYYVSKSGSNSNNGLSYATSFLTISQAMTTAGAVTTTIIVGSGLYNEKLNIPNATYTFYMDGVVVLDGTGIANNPAINQPSGTMIFQPYTNGGWLIIQNHIATSYLVYNNGTAVTFYNTIFINNGMSYPENSDP